MRKKVLQLIALILVMTAGLNAQCVASCAIASVAQSPDHACCPHHKAVHNETPQAPALPPALAFQVTPQLVPAQVSSLFDLPVNAILPAPIRPALTTALRI
jgi:hypothetical protein